jgi:hypothetical protein
MKLHGWVTVISLMIVEPRLIPCAIVAVILLKILVKNP